MFLTLEFNKILSAFSLGKAKWSKVKWKNTRGGEGGWKRPVENIY